MYIYIQNLLKEHLRHKYFSSANICLIMGVPVSIIFFLAPGNKIFRPK